MNTRITTVPEYIASFPQPAQVMMRQLRTAILSAAPRAQETISYRIPFYQYRSPGFPGRMAYFGAFRTHVSVFVVPRKVPPTLAKKMKPYQAGRATLRFPLGTKIPIAMVKQLVKIRMKEIDQSLASGKVTKRK